MFCVITASSSPRRSSSASARVRAVRALVAERREALAVEAPEAHRVARGRRRCARPPSGRRFSHRPVPGVRKSGIPEGTEMPAPVSATTEPRVADELAPSRSTPAARGARRGAVPRSSAPLNRGARLPRKAAMPSLASSLAKAVAKARFSASMPSSRSPAPETRLICSTRERRLPGELARPRRAPCRAVRGPRRRG